MVRRGADRGGLPAHLDRELEALSRESGRLAILALRYAAALPTDPMQRRS
jgi:hypothetical protein